MSSSCSPCLKREPTAAPRLVRTWEGNSSAGREERNFLNSKGATRNLGTRSVERINFTLQLLISREPKFERSQRAGAANLFSLALPPDAKTAIRYSRHAHLIGAVSQGVTDETHCPASPRRCIL